ncbi:hypothetical protein JB92DRAFT_3092034 [Gautieria morchelliformis]|nr:hypothetical protein JB92DRAFT_3092034 [Gautieria morchelliformis]
MTMESHWGNVFQEYPDSRSRLRWITLSDSSITATPLRVTDWIYYCALPARTPLRVTDWMSYYYCVLPVRTVVHQSTIFIRDFPRMARLLQLIGPSLEHLTLSIHQREVEYHLWKLLSPIEIDLLSSNTGLRTLTFDGQVLFSPHPGAYAWLPILLSQATSRYIEEISFVLFSDQVGHLIETVDLQLVQDIIAKLVSLKRVNFRWRGGDPVAASRAIKARMDQLDRMGLLVFRRDT